ncbi:MAG: tyrosine-protein phosphatase [Mycetocola sp.]
MTKGAGSDGERRRLNIPGLFNGRDLGGLPAADGRIIARGRLYRAEVLGYAGADELYSRWVPEQTAALRDLGIRTVIDMRGAAETVATPSAWREAARAKRGLSFPIDDGGEGTARDYVGMLVAGEMGRFSATDMGEHYVATLENRADVFVSAIDAIANGAPALVHCTEGKDRTGLLVALVLSLLGTPSRAIVEDYRLTEIWRPDRALAWAPRFAGTGLDLERFRVLYESPPAAMEIALGHLETVHGGAQSFLMTRGGMPAKTVSRLRNALLAPPRA